MTLADLGDLTDECGPTACVVFCMLGTYADRDGGSSRPMQRTIAERSGLSKRTVRRAIEDLARAGWLTATWQITPAGKRRVYELHYRAPLRASRPRGD
jgi:DNA-binding transcriptional MocR family regulator